MAGAGHSVSRGARDVARQLAARVGSRPGSPQAARYLHSSQSPRGLSADLPHVPSPAELIYVSVLAAHRCGRPRDFVNTNSEDNHVYSLFWRPRGML